MLIRGIRVYVARSAAWKSLPFAATHLEHTASFKRHLKSILFHLALSKLFLVYLFVILTVTFLKKFYKSNFYFILVA